VALSKIILAALSLLAAAQASWFYDPQNQSDVASPTSQASACPDDRAWSGKYRNYSYGFSIVIPKNLKGFWNSPACVANSDGCVCMQDHGRIIPLSDERDGPDRLMEAYAGNLDNSTLVQAVKSELGSIRESGRKNSFHIRKRFPIQLSGRKGERVVVRYFDGKANQWMIEDFVELLRGGVEYSLYLRTPEGTYEHDRRIFDTLIASFVFTKRVW
jgi:hypothetical protein